MPVRHVHVTEFDKQHITHVLCVDGFYGCGCSDRFDVNCAACKAVHDRESEHPPLCEMSGSLPDDAREHENLPLINVMIFL